MKESQLRNKLEHKLNLVFFFIFWSILMIFLPYLSFLQPIADFGFRKFGYWIPSLSTYLPLKKFSVSVSWVPMMEVVSPHIIIRTRTPSSAFFSKSSPRVKEAKSTSVLVFKSCQSLPLETKEKRKGK